MKKYLFLILFLVILIILILPISDNENYNYVEIDGEKIIIEISKTPEEMQRGLMFRENLCPNCGMLFIFEEENFHGFWMKNTLIPLDMIFIDSDLNIVDILYAEPCTEDPCKSYTPKKKILYVLETNGGKYNESIIGMNVKLDLK